MPDHGDRVMRGPAASSENAKRRMQATRQVGTASELALREELNRLGLQYTVNRAPLAGLRRNADIVFPNADVAVFVDGCFWHGCPHHGTTPIANRDWWVAKIEANKKRDSDTDNTLQSAGWTVLRFWAHTPAQEAAQEVARAVACRTTECNDAHKADE